MTKVKLEISLTMEEAHSVYETVRQERFINEFEDWLGCEQECQLCSTDNEAMFAVAWQIYENERSFFKSESETFEDVYNGLIRKYGSDNIVWDCCECGKTLISKSPECDTDDGQAYCDSCADKLLAWCDYCGGHFRKDKLISQPDGLFCKDCLDKLGQRKF